MRLGLASGGIGLGEGFLKKEKKKTTSFLLLSLAPKDPLPWPLIKKGEFLLKLFLFTPAVQFWGLASPSLGWKTCKGKINQETYCHINLQAVCLVGWFLLLFLIQVLISLPICLLEFTLQSPHIVAL